MYTRRYLENTPVSLESGGIDNASAQLAARLRALLEVLTGGEEACMAGADLQVKAGT
jgi:hypothetical protein